MLILALLMTFVPSYVVAVDATAIDNRSVDANTWDEWKLLFGPDHPTTENAGAGCLSAIAILGKKADEIED